MSSTSTRRPTAQQVDLLAAVERGEVKWCYGRQGGYTVLVGRQDKPVTAAAERLLDRGWTEGPDGGTGVHTDRLTPEGARVLADARAWAEFEAAPRDLLNDVYVTGVDLGRSPIRGGNNRPFRGREVYCRRCADTRRRQVAAGEQPAVQGRVDRVNGCTREDVQWAEEKRRDHVLAHLRGEVPA